MEQLYHVVYGIEGLEKSVLRYIPGLEEAMQQELMRVYHTYADRCNSGITDELNEEWNRLNPNYFEDNKDKEWYDLTEYNKFIADGYQRLVIDKLSEDEASPLLDFYVDPSEIVFTGCLKANHEITIQFWLKEAEL